MSKIEFVPFPAFRVCKQCVHYDNCSTRKDIFTDANRCKSYEKKDGE